MEVHNLDKWKPRVTVFQRISGLDMSGSCDSLGVTLTFVFSNSEDDTLTSLYLAVCSSDSLNILLEDLIPDMFCRTPVALSRVIHFLLWKS